MSNVSRVARAFTVPPYHRERSPRRRAAPRPGSRQHCDEALDPLHAKQRVALVGVVPYNCDSGTMHGCQRVWGGRAEVRAVLSRSTLVATCYNLMIRACYARLLAAGKRKKVAW